MNVLDVLRTVDRASVRVIITGMGGIGKTALAIHAGQLVTDQFPGGQLYVNLRGYDP